MLWVGQANPVRTESASGLEYAVTRPWIQMIPIEYAGDTRKLGWSEHLGYGDGSVFHVLDNSTIEYSMVQLLRQN